MKISVVIPSYNRAHLLPRTIKSVIDQTYQDFEIVIVDDCSQDDTYDVVMALKNTYDNYDIRYIAHQKNRGESGARNTGIENSLGEYVAFLDSDDEWLPEKLCEQISFLKDNSCDGVVCEYYLVDNNEKISLSFQGDTLNSLDLFTKGCGFGIGTNLLIKRSKLQQRFDENLKLFADMDWLYRLLKESSIKVLHKPLALYYKAPMRSGDYIHEHAVIFLKKYENEIKKFSWFQKNCFKSVVNWYVAIAYDQNGFPNKALKYYLLGLIQNPFRHIGNYVHIMKIILKSAF